MGAVVPAPRRTLLVLFLAAAGVGMCYARQVRALPPRAGRGTVASPVCCNLASVSLLLEEKVGWKRAQLVFGPGGVTPNLRRASCALAADELRLVPS